MPNRADTDGDGLNDMEEINLGADGFPTHPWRAATVAILGFLFSFLAWTQDGAYTYTPEIVRIRIPGRGSWSYEKSSLLTGNRKYSELPGTGSAVIWALVSLGLTALKLSLPSTGLDRPVHGVSRQQWQRSP